MLITVFDFCETSFHNNHNVIIIFFKSISSLWLISWLNQIYKSYYSGIVVPRTRICDTVH